MSCPARPRRPQPRTPTPSFDSQMCVATLGWIVLGGVGRSCPEPSVLRGCAVRGLALLTRPWLRVATAPLPPQPRGGRESIAVLQMVWKRRYPSIIMPYFHYNRGESTGAGQSAPIGVAKISPHPADTLRRRLYKLSPQLDRRVGADEVAARSAHNGGWSSPSYSQSCHSVTPTRHAAAARRILLCCCRGRHSDTRPQCRACAGQWPAAAAAAHNVIANYSLVRRAMIFLPPEFFKNKKRYCSSN